MRELDTLPGEGQYLASITAETSAQWKKLHGSLYLPGTPVIVEPETCGDRGIVYVRPVDARPVQGHHFWYEVDPDQIDLSPSDAGSA